MALQKMNFHQEMENSETNKVLTRRGKKRVRVDRHAGGLRERVVPSWWPEHLLRLAPFIRFIPVSSYPAHTPLSQDRF